MVVDRKVGTGDLGHRVTLEGIMEGLAITHTGADKDPLSVFFCEREEDTSKQ
jgi:hypothetical protein